MKVRLDHIENLTDVIKMLWFKPERRMRYQAGQFTQLHLPHDLADNRGDTRWFTLSSSPTENMLAITTRFLGDKSSSFKQQLFSLKRGAQLNLADPMGDFVLPKDKTIPLIFVAGGIGVTPIRSIIKYLSDSGEQRQVTLFYSVSNPSDAIFIDLFDSYDLKLNLVEGRIGADTLLPAIQADKRSLVFISGPEPMVEALQDDLQLKSVNKRWIVVDSFPGYKAI